jgi:ADP-heptose:LPS heptosyltransferase
MKIALIKLMDRLLGGCVAGVLPAPRRRPVPEVRKVLLIRPGGIGDAVLLVPAIRALKRAFPECRIELLAEKRNAAAFALCPEIEAVHRYDSPRGLLAVLTGGYDVVVDTEQWYRLSAVVARLTRAPLLVGFAGNRRERLFTDPVAYPLESYELCSFFRLLEPLGVAPLSRFDAPFLQIPAAASAQADRLLGALAGRPFVALFPGASTPEKRWGVDNFARVVAHLRARGVAVVLVGGEDSMRDGAALAGEGVLDLTGRTPLAVTAALLGRGRALVTGDSGLLHIAAGLGIATVSLFGPSDPGKWGPTGSRHLQVSAGLDCAPCSRYGTTPPCPVRVRCISGIAAAEVIAAVDEILAGRA